MSPGAGAEPRLRAGQLFVLGAAVLWGTTGTAQAFAPAAAQPAAVGALRLALGGGFLLLLAASRGVLDNPLRWPRRATLVAGCAMALYNGCFFAAVLRTGVAVGTIVAIGSGPVVGGVLGMLVYGERPGGRWLAATLLAVAGCALLLGGGERVSVDPLGVLLAFAAGSAYAIFAVAGKGLLATRPPDAVMAVVFCLGALLLAPLLVVLDLGWLRSPAGLGAVLFLGLVSTAAAYALFARGLARVPVSSAVTLALAEPLTAGALGVLLLGERLSAAALAGVVLILAGLALVSLRRPRAVAARLERRGARE